MAANGAWASNDPEHMTTYGLMADYALGTALDSVEAAQGEIEAVLDDTVTEALEAGHEHRHPAPDED
jgi:hypothetical protein